MTFEITVGEFTVDVSAPYPYWVRIVHEYSDGYTKFSHEELDDLLYALASARNRINEHRASSSRGAQ